VDVAREKRVVRLAHQNQVAAGFREPSPDRRAIALHRLVDLDGGGLPDLLRRPFSRVVVDDQDLVDDVGGSKIENSGAYGLALVVRWEHD